MPAGSVFTNVGTPFVNDIIKDSKKFSSGSISLKTVGVTGQILPEFTNKFPNDGDQYGCVIIYKNELHVFNDGTNDNSHYKFNGSQWVRLNDLPNGSSFFKPLAIILNCPEQSAYNGLFVYNVWESGGDSSCYRWNESDDSWTKMFDLPPVSTVGGIYPVIYECPDGTRGRCYAIGGQANPKKVYQRINSGGSWVWEEVSVTLPGNLYWGYGGACFLDEGDESYVYLHIVATNTHSKIKCNRSSGYISTPLSFTQLNNLAPLDTAHYTNLKNINGKLYAFNRSTRKVLKWDQSTDTWSDVFLLPYADFGDVDMDDKLTGYELGSMNDQSKTKLGYKFIPSYSLDII